MRMAKLIANEIISYKVIPQSLLYRKKVLERKVSAQYNIAMPLTQVLEQNSISRFSVLGSRFSVLGS